MSGVVEIPEAPEARHERRSKGIEATELCGESLECSNSTMKQRLKESLNCRLIGCSFFIVLCKRIVFVERISQRLSAARYLNCQSSVHSFKPHNGQVITEPPREAMLRGGGIQRLRVHHVVMQQKQLFEASILAIYVVRVEEVRFT